MSLNLLDSIKNEVSSTVIDKISNYLGESRGNTSNAITAAIPAILAFFSEKSKTESGASSLINLATDSGLAGLFSGNSFTDVFEKNRDSLMSQGNSMLIDLFGNKEAELSKEISNYANVSKESSDGILASILPLVMSVLGSKIAGNGLDASSLAGLFAGEKDSIFSAIPAGLASLGGILGLGKLGSVADSVTDTVKDTTSRVTSAFSEKVETAKTHIKEETTFDDDDNNGGGFMKWLLPLLGILAALALLWFLMQKCEKDSEPVVEDQTVVTDSLTDVNVSVPAVDIRGTYDSINNRFVYDLGAEKEITLADGTVLKVGDNSTEWKLFDFISNDANSVSDDKSQGWITLDRVYFETGSNALTAESKAQLDNIAAIMKAYPDAKAKFGGYTDNSGSDEVNIPLSNDRATAVMNDVVKTGIDAARVAAEGYGSQHPICPANDTPTCMAQNRRVDIRVTSK